MNIYQSTEFLVLVSLTSTFRLIMSIFYSFTIQALDYNFRHALQKYFFFSNAFCSYYKHYHEDWLIFCNSLPLLQFLHCEQDIKLFMYNILFTWCTALTFEVFCILVGWQFYSFLNFVRVVEAKGSRDNQSKFQKTDKVKTLLPCAMEENVSLNFNENIVRRTEILWY